MQKKKKNEEELSSSPLATCVIILSEDTQHQCNVSHGIYKVLTKGIDKFP